jgi:hypothetical protein
MREEHAATRQAVGHVLVAKLAHGTPSGTAVPHTAD